jgi:superfamily II DNA or RNA helicase
MKKTREKIQEEALEVALNNTRCTLAISMGVGKTYIGLLHMDRIYTKSEKYLVVAPKLSIIESWKAEARKFKLDYLLQNITFTTYLSLNKFLDNQFDYIYLDECHSLKYSHDFLLMSHQGGILGLTGTPPIRKGSEKYEMINKYCPVRYSFGVDDATENNILNDYQIIIHTLTLDQRNNYWKTLADGRSFKTSELKQYEFWSRKVAEAPPGKSKAIASVQRMKNMMEFPSKEKYAKVLADQINNKCIIFANTKNQADALCSHSYHSGNSDSENNLQMFKDGKITKLSCVLQLNEGVSVPNLRSGIILHAYGNETKSAQRIGRLLRLNPNDKATCHILMYEGTVDQQWVTSALKSFDSSKIKYYDHLKFEYRDYE